MTTEYLLGDASDVHSRDFSEVVSTTDRKNTFFTSRCRDKDVLDLGCVEHNPQNYQSKYWTHRALREVSRSLLGMDLYEPGVAYLRERGFDIIAGDATNFQLDRTFEVIVAGDLIEHLSNMDGFLRSCRAHLRPGGRILIATPNPWYWRYTVKAALFSEVSSNPEHTCWFDPRTLRQLVNRYGMELGEVEFASRYLRDRLTPLPRALKHTSFNAEIKLV